MEMLDEVDVEGRPTGRVFERAYVHAHGIRHRTAHVWLVRDRGNGTEILLQKRSADKDSFPGCYDISSAGHIPAGADYVESALRELGEELGITAAPEDLIPCGTVRVRNTTDFYGQPFKDDQVSRVYYMRCDREENEFTLQPEELESVLWMPLKECIRRFYDPDFRHCLIPEEMRLLPAALEEIIS